MATQTGKHGLENDFDNIANPAKRAKREASSNKLDSFLKWCDSNDIVINSKTVVTEEGTSAQYGMVAVENISEGETIFEIPRAVLLTPETSNISELLTKEGESLRSESGWVPLLIALLHEYTTATSKWAPYTQLVPDFDQLYTPMFWSDQELNNNLKCTGVIRAVKRDEKHINDEFTTIALPFIKSHPQYFSNECHDIKLYKKMVAFVMAYSFTEPDPIDEEDEECEEDGATTKKNLPQMVPLADILNHVAKNNAHLDFGEKTLKMVAVKNIRKGEEIYNTYGELSNMHLLHMYGFAEPYPNNHFDTVDIPHSQIFECLKVNATEISLLYEKWTHLKSIGLVDDSRECVVGDEGILTEIELLSILRILHMNKEEFAQAKKNSDGWESDEEEESLIYTDFKNILPEWKNTLGKIAKWAIGLYQHTLEEEAAIEKFQKWNNPKEKYSHYVRYGQLKLLHKLLENCTGASCIKAD